jgi:hypothetical protein
MNKEYNGYFLGTRSGVITPSTEFYDWKLLQSFINKDVYWHSREWQEQDDLPRGHRAYLIKTENADLDWICQQAARISAPMFILNGLVNDYGAVDHLSNVSWLPWIEWHYQIESMLRDYDAKVTKRITKKISCLSNISRPHRMISTAAVDLYFGQDSMITWHGRCYRPTDDQQAATGHPEFDRWIDRWRSMDLPRLGPDAFTVNVANDVTFQRLIHDFHHDAYQTCAFNVTNECDYHSAKVVAGRQITMPGPWLTEKTLKCLVGETAFIANGNRQTYSTLESLGFVFDYGQDLAYDQIPGDLDRVCAMTKVLANISQHDAADLFNRTRSSCLHNKQHLMSRQFWKICENINEQTVQHIHTSI